MEYQIILTTVIALVAILTGLGFVFNILLTPLKENQVKFESRMGALESRMGALESKMDQLLAQNKQRA